MTTKFTMKGDTTMNARDALTLLEYQVQDGYAIAPELRQAIAVLAAVLDERAELEALTYNVYAAIRRYQARDALKGGEPNDSGLG